MAAFNWITAEIQCPSCGTRILARIQTHIASDLDGDETGRFCERDYRLGERMAWFPPEHPDFDFWRSWGLEIPGRTAYEYCHTSCGKCGTKLFARIEFVDVTPVAVSEVGLQTEWPKNFKKPGDPFPSVL